MHLAIHSASWPVVDGTSLPVLPKSPTSFADHSTSSNGRNLAKPLGVRGSNQESTLYRGEEHDGACTYPHDEAWAYAHK